MANIIKSSSGLLFAEELWTDLSLLWDLSPNDPSRVVLNSNSISLLPGDQRLELLISAPKENGYVIQTELDYRPTTASESAGCTMKSITGNYIDLEVRGDTLVTCTYTKMIINENSILNAIASNGGTTWIDYGNTKVIDMNKIGYYVGEGSSASQLDIKKCIMYKNNFVTINNFDRTNVLKLFDSTGHEVTSQFIVRKKNTQMCIDGTNIIYPIDYLKVQSCDRITGAVLYEGELRDIYGGDIFEYEYDLEFYIDNNLLTNTIYNLGQISGERIFDLKISNKEAYDLNNRKLKVSYYNIYNPGFKLAQIAEGGSADFKTELDISILAGETKVYKLKAVKDKSILNIENEYKFNIIFE